MNPTLDAAILDSSVLLCIMLSEPAAPLFLDGLSRTRQLYIGAPTRAESWLAAHNAKGPAGPKKIDRLLDALKVVTVDFTCESLPFFEQGAGTHHHKVDKKARLNMGDLFTYAVVRQLNLPLFFQGTDFANTNIPNAMKNLGYAVSDLGAPLSRTTLRP